MGFDHGTTTRPYLEGPVVAPANVPNHIEQDLRWVSATNYLESQAADLYACFLKAAVWPDRYGNFEGGYLRTVWHQLRNSEGCAIPLGLMSIPESSLVACHDWFPCDACKYKKAG